MVGFQNKYHILEAFWVSILNFSGVAQLRSLLMCIQVAVVTPLHQDVSADAGNSCCLFARFFFFCAAFGSDGNGHEK